MREKSKLISGLKSEKLLKQPIKFYSDLEKQKITHKKPSNLPTVRKIASARKNGEPALAVNAKNVENQKRRLRLGLAPLLFYIFKYFAERAEASFFLDFFGTFFIKKKSTEKKNFNTQKFLISLQRK